ncbi:MAG: glycosyltransferase family A protein, partial [Verrucomicrobiota bacterium]
MTISVVIPTCDRPEFLPETLESVFGQTRKPDEVVVVNNGPAEAQLPAEFSNWIRVLDIIPYAGACQARNFGASTVSGDLIAFIDDDDIWADDYLANVEAAFAADDVACTVSRLDTLRDGKIEPWKCADGLMTKANLMTFNPGITGSNVVISKEAFFAVRGYNPQLRTGEDKSLILELLRSGRTVATLPKNQVCIRDHGGVRLSNHAKMADGVND